MSDVSRLVDVDYAAYLSRHDLVYESPPNMPTHGIPLGDGETGALLWTPPDAIRFELGRNDLWDDGPERPFEPWGHEDEEVASALRAAGQLSIAPGLPILDRLYLNDFELRLDLHHATAQLRSETPLGKVRAEVFMPARAENETAGLLCVDYRDELSEAVSREIALERWGTRVFGHWYRLIRRDPELGLDGTESGMTDGVAWIMQQTRTTRFAVAMLVDGIDTTIERQHSRACVVRTEPVTFAAFRVYLSVVTSAQAKDPVGAAVERVQRGQSEGAATLRERHRRNWAAFWSQSFVNIPNDYAENLWYLNHYVVGSSARGDYPPSFINGIWPPHRDLHPWNHCYHWNQQQITWPCATAGHPELAHGWLHMRRDQLPRMADSARRRFDAEGAWFADVFDRRGWQSEGPPITTPGLQIALDAWRTWRHTGDETFLRDVAWPILREVCRFSLDRGYDGEDGRWHPSIGHPYEHASEYDVRDGLTDIAHIRAAFPKAAEIAERFGEHAFADELRRAVNRMAEPELIPIPDHYLNDDGTLAIGHGGGQRPESDRIIAAGRRVEDDQPVYYRCDMAGIGSDALFPGVNEALVYPSGAIGLADRGTTLFDAMRMTAIAHYCDGFGATNSLGVMGWSVAQIVFARLGMREWLNDSIDRHIRCFQHFPNGMWNYHHAWDESDTNLGTMLPVHDWKDTDPNPRQFPFPQHPHTHFGLEPGAILQTTVNEMLLQSYDGTIRVAPAVPDGWNATFILHGEGGFRVACAVENGRAQRVEITSKRGETCRLVPDWDGDPGEWDVTSVDGRTENTRIDGEALVFDTEPGATYRVSRRGAPWKPVGRFGGERNQTAKSHGGIKNNAPRRIGLPKMW